MGTCTIHSYLNYTAGDAYLRITRADGSTFFAGGKEFANRVLTSRTDITTDVIASCLDSIAASSITNFSSVYHGTAHFDQTGENDGEEGNNGKALRLDFEIGSFAYHYAVTALQDIGADFSHIQDPDKGDYIVTMSTSATLYGVSLSDFTVTNGTLSILLHENHVHPSASVLRLTHDGSTADATIVLRAGTVRTPEFVNNRASDVYSITGSGTGTGKPTASPLTFSPADSGIGYDISITFSEAVQGLEEGDFAITNARLSNLTSTNPSDDHTSQYTAKLTLTGAGDASIQIKSNSVTDTDGNANEDGSDALAVPLESNSATITLAPDQYGTADVRAAFHFVHAVTGFAAKDITVTGGTISSFTKNSSTQYDVRIDPFDVSTEDTIIVTLTANNVHSKRDNVPVTATSNTIHKSPATIAAQQAAERNTPTATTTRVEMEDGIGYAITIRFSTDVAVDDALQIDDLRATNADLSEFSASSNTNNRSYTVRLTPDGGGKVTLALADGAVTNANNANTHAAQKLLAFSPATPTVMITLGSSEYSAADMEVTFDFSEKVTAFNATDIEVSGGSLVANSVQQSSDDETIYTARISPDKDGTQLTVSLAEQTQVKSLRNNIALLATSSNTINKSEQTINEQETAKKQAAATDQRQAREIAAANAQVSSLMAARINNLLQNQPRLSGLLDGTTPGNYRASLGNHLGKVRLNGGGRSVWGSYQYASRTNGKGAASTFHLVAAGAHTRLAATHLLGVLVESDTLQQSTTTGGGKPASTGLLLGPYYVTRLGNDLNLESRLLFGKATSTIYALENGQKSKARSNRLLLMMSLNGSIQSGNLTWTPRLSFHYAKETQSAYDLDSRTTAPRQGLTLAEADFGIDLVRRITTLGGNDLLLTGSLANFLARVSGNGAFTPHAREVSGHRSGYRLHLGINYQTRGGWRAATSLFWEGAADQAEYGSHGFTLGATYRF